MRYCILLFSMVVLLQACLKCPDDYVAPQEIQNPPVLTASQINSNVVTISWIFTSTHQDQFKIERKTGNSDFILIDSTNSDKYMYSDSTVVAHSNYVYRIHIIDNNSQSSLYSNELAVSTD